MIVSQNNLNKKSVKNFMSFHPGSVNLLENTLQLTQQSLCLSQKNKGTEAVLIQQVSITAQESQKKNNIKRPT
jgi:hypothetical protein